MKLTYYGHSCFALDINGKHLIFDPFISPNEKARKVIVEEIRADYVILSHGHEDHIADAERIVKNTGATLIANWEVGEWFEKRGVEKVHRMNIGGCANFCFGKLKMTPAIHSSSLPDGSYGGCAAGFVVETDRGNLYYSGDTALFSDMKLIGERCHINIAVLCIGGNYTMNAQDAAHAAKWVKANTAVGVHYDTFPEIVTDHAEAKRHFHAHGINLLLPTVGESITG